MIKNIFNFIKNKIISEGKHFPILDIDGKEIGHRFLNKKWEIVEQIVNPLYVEIEQEGKIVWVLKTEVPEEAKVLGEDVGWPANEPEKNNNTTDEKDNTQTEQNGDLPCIEEEDKTYTDKEILVVIIQNIEEGNNPFKFKIIRLLKEAIGKMN